MSPAARAQPDYAWGMKDITKLTMILLGVTFFVAQSGGSRQLLTLGWETGRPPKLRVWRGISDRVLFQRVEQNKTRVHVL